MSPRSTPVARRVPGPQLLPPLTLRGITFRNRLVVAPMCQYPATGGLLGDYHLGHLGRFALGGSGLVVVEATGVTPAGRLGHSDVGIWPDAGLARVAAVRAEWPARERRGGGRPTRVQRFGTATGRAPHAA
jgi:2,4-dienoyl-CoA reductase-like NADH-dependent reductase (Old Yellow Enzyme family)